MKSSLQHKEKTLNSSGVLLRALFWSAALHALAFAMLAPEFGGDDRRVPPDRILQGHLALPAALAEAVPLVPHLAPPPVTQQHRPHLPAPMTAPPAPALAAFPVTTVEQAIPVPPPTVDPLPRHAAEAGGVPVPHDAAAPTTAALVPEPRETGLDASGLRQFRVALAGEARRFRHYPDAARRDGLSGTAEIRVAVNAADRLAEVARSSGHALLDAAALDMMRQAALRAQLPDSLRGQRFAVLLPVVFTVED